MLSTLLRAKSVFLHDYRESSEHSQLLQEFYAKIARYDYRWMISKLDNHRIVQLKKQFQIFSANPTADSFVFIVLNIFGKTEPLTNFCLGLAALNLYYMVRGPENLELTYKQLIDFIYLVLLE